MKHINQPIKNGNMVAETRNFPRFHWAKKVPPFCPENMESNPTIGGLYCRCFLLFLGTRGKFSGFMRVFCGCIIFYQGSISLSGWLICEASKCHHLECSKWSCLYTSGTYVIGCEKCAWLNLSIFFNDTYIRSIYIYIQNTHVSVYTSPFGVYWILFGDYSIWLAMCVTQPGHHVF